MPARLLHLSDLHFGAHDDRAIVNGTETLIDRFEPDLVIASGDLTHRGRRDQHERAGTFLHGLGRPLLTIPGNHDVPYTLPARLTQPWVEFERIWKTTEQTWTSPEVHAIGLNSVRPWRQQSGRLREQQLARARERLEAAPAGALRVVVLHHHLIGAPWRSRKKPVARRNHVLASLVDAGADLILAGHIHQAAVSERREFEISRGSERGVVVSIAPGLGQPRPQRQGEARGLHVYDVSGEALRIETYTWREKEWGLTAMRLFPRGLETLATEPISAGGLGSPAR